MDEVICDLTGLLYQTELIIVPFTNPLIRPESLSRPGALLGKQTRRQSGSLTFPNFQSNGKHFQFDLSARHRGAGASYAAEQIQLSFI